MNDEERLILKNQKEIMEALVRLTIIGIAQGRLSKTDIDDLRNQIRITERILLG